MFTIGARYGCVNPPVAFAVIAFAPVLMLAVPVDVSVTVPASVAPDVLLEVIAPVVILPELPLVVTVTLPPTPAVLDVVMAPVVTAALPEVTLTAAPRVVIAPMLTVPAPSAPRAIVPTGAPPAAMLKAAKSGVAEAIRTVPVPVLPVPPLLVLKFVLPATMLPLVATTVTLPLFWPATPPELIVIAGRVMLPATRLICPPEFTVVEFESMLVNANPVTRSMLPPLLVMFVKVFMLSPAVAPVTSVPAVRLLPPGPVQVDPAIIVIEPPELLVVKLDAPARLMLPLAKNATLAP